MKIGDLVRYKAQPTASFPQDANEELGIITQADNPTPYGEVRWHVVWFTCANRGWWSYKNLEVVSESR